MVPNRCLFSFLIAGILTSCASPVSSLKEPVSSPKEQEQIRIVFQAPPPHYPPLAKIAGIEGVVTVEVMVDKDGIPVSAKGISGPPQLYKVAEENLMQWRFQLPDKHLNPPLVRLKFDLVFKLNK